MSAGQAILAKLAARHRVGERVIIIVAHPDDETIGLGAQLCRFDDALLAHATDGAPHDGRDAAAYGFTTRSDYAASRRAELAAALVAGDALRLSTLCLGIVDQEAMHHLAPLTMHIRALLEEETPRAVITHAYEGGHPDHDACAFAVHTACRLVPEPPPILETALYHRRENRLVSGEFLHPTSWGEDNGVSLELDQDELQRKQRMIDCFTTQRWLLVQLNTGIERLRIAPHYDFGAPPHAGELHYETLGWGITGEDWRRYAAAASTELGCRCR